MNGVSPDLQGLLLKEAVSEYSTEKEWFATRKQVLHELQVLKLEEKIWLTEKIFQQAHEKLLAYLNSKQKSFQQKGHAFVFLCPK